MAQFGDFIARLFSTGGTMGLSGEASSVFQAGLESAAYKDQLRRHRAEQDLVTDPSLLWATSAVLRRRGGLVAHLMSQKSDAVADFTDVLLVLNQADWRRAIQLRDAWAERLVGLVRDRFDQLCQTEDYHLMLPTRQLGVRLLEDGGPEMQGHSLGLRTGEFVTGLLPNTYAGPQEGSRPVVSVFLHLPERWEGYREVGRLWSDQLQFTLGSHWLDNFSDPGLLRPSLYRLQQFSDGSLVHVIHPDLQDEFRVASHTTPDGASVVSLLDKGNRPFAHLILALVDEGDQLSTRGLTRSTGSSITPDPGGSPALPPMLVGGGHRTVVPHDLDERIFRVRERGVLFQKVHFNKFMEGYDVYLGPDGGVGTNLADRAGAFQIRGRTVALVAFRPGLRVEGIALSQGARVPLDGNVRITIGDHTIDYVGLGHIDVEGWPYLGEVRRSGGTVSMVFGGVYKIGRDRGVKVRLPDEPENDNIVWLPGVGDGATIRSRTGEIPKSRFYTDSIMVASQHAEIDLRGEPALTSMARNCYTFVRRDRELIGLQPADRTAGALRTTLRSGDEILIGNCVFEVLFSAEPEELPAPPRIHTLLPTPVISADLPPAPPLGAPAPAPPRIDLSMEALFDEDERGGPARFALAGAGPTEFPGEREEREKKTGPRLVLRQGAAPPKPPPAPEMPRAPTDPGTVQIVAEDDWQLELSRPARLQLMGWMVHGDVRVGNHRHADVVIPENQARPDQSFTPADYFEVAVRAGRASARRVDRSEARLVVGGELVVDTNTLDRATLLITRRDPHGDPDFEVSLTLRYDPLLPDPRAQLLAPDLTERMARALFVLGLPLRAVRTIELGPIRANATFDGQGLVLQGYLDSYRKGEGFHPFFVRHGSGPYRTVSEDGAPVHLSPGDRLVAGGAVYVFERD